VQQNLPREPHENPFSSVVEQISADLGMPGDARLYAGRVATLARECGLPAADFYGALVAAWKTTQVKRDQGALERPHAGLAYFFTVLTDRVEGQPQAKAAATSGPGELQDGRFLDQVRQRLGQLDDQQAWSRILQGLADSMTRPNYTRWFARSAAMDDGDNLVVIVADTLQRDWVSKHLSAVVRREALACDEQRTVRFVALQDVVR
jgi:hypothetical protein